MCSTKINFLFNNTQALYNISDGEDGEIYEYLI